MTEEREAKVPFGLLACHGSPKRGRQVSAGGGTFAFCRSSDQPGAKGTAFSNGTLTVQAL